jgi:hypothetical protein
VGLHCSLLSDRDVANDSPSLSIDYILRLIPQNQRKNDLNALILLRNLYFLEYKHTCSGSTKLSIYSGFAEKCLS